MRGTYSPDSLLHPIAPRKGRKVLVLYRERSGEESSGKAGIVSAGAFPIQRLERSRFGTVELWVLNSGEGGEGWG